MSIGNNYWDKCVVILLVILSGAFLYLLAPLLLPFAGGALIAYLCNPLVKKLESYRVPHLFAVVIVFSVIFLIVAQLIFLVIPSLIQKQVATLSVQLPSILNWINAKTFPWLKSHFDLQADNNIEAFKNVFSENLAQAGGAATWVGKTILHSGKALFEAIVNMILIPIVTFYLLRDWTPIMINIRDSFPRKMKPTLIKLARECDSVLSGFFRGQLFVMLALTVYYAIALSIVGLQLSVIIALIIGVTSILPYLGLMVGLVIAIIAALVQFGTLSSVLWVLLVFVIGHSVENFYLTPKLIGDRIGLHPVVVIFSILAGGTLFGFFGVLLALPVAAVIMVLLRNLHQHYHRHEVAK
jgi:predicted PurR-regulated permease PerM